MWLRSHECLYVIFCQHPLTRFWPLNLLFNDSTVQGPKEHFQHGQSKPDWLESMLSHTVVCWTIPSPFLAAEHLLVHFLCTDADIALKSVPCIGTDVQSHIIAPMISSAGNLQLKRREVMGRRRTLSIGKSGVQCCFRKMQEPNSLTQWGRLCCEFGAVFLISRWAGPNLSWKLRSPDGSSLWWHCYY